MEGRQGICGSLELWSANSFLGQAVGLAGELAGIFLDIFLPTAL